MTNEATRWVRPCFPDDPVEIDVLATHRGGSGCPVYFASGLIGAGKRRIVVKVYSPGFDDYSGLGPHDTARKHALALEELRAAGFPVPGLVGWSTAGAAAAVITEWVAGRDAGLDRRQAAAVLARLHRIGPGALGPELEHLVDRSRPNRDRIRRGVLEMAPQCDETVPGWRSESPELAGTVDEIVGSPEPDAGIITLQHGDYFGVNLLPVAKGRPVIVDWDLLARGDPMWDLGHLMAADPHNDPADHAIPAAYRKAGGPLDPGTLRRRLQCWEAFWGLRRILHGA